MAYNDFFGEIDHCLGVSSMAVIRTTVLTGGVNPVALFAVGAIEVSITLFDAFIIPTTTVGGGTALVNTDIGGGGAAALTNAMACATAGTVARSTLMVVAQRVVGPADAIEVVRANDGPGGDGCNLHLLCHLT